MLPLISIVIPNMNGMEHLPECLASLRTAAYPADRQEWILSDNGSQDGSVDFVKQTYPRARLVQNGGNIGFAKGCNNGAAAAAGDYVVFLNNDTRVHPDWLSGYLSALARDPAAVCAASHMLSWDGRADDFDGASCNLFGVGRQRSVTGWPDCPLGLAEGDPLLFACGGAMIVERRVFLDAGGFDPTFFIYFEDVDLGWRLWVLGHKVVYAPGSIVYHKGGGTTGESRAPSHRRYLLFETNTLSAIFKNYSQPLLDRLLPAALLLEFQRALLSAGDALNPEHYRLGGKVSDPQIEQHGVARLPPISVAHLLAMGRFVERLPHLAAERARIQQARRRPDDEILPLFGRPFQPQFAGRRYADVVRSIAAALDLYPLVGGVAPNRMLVLSPAGGPGAARARGFADLLAPEFHVALAEKSGEQWRLAAQPGAIQAPNVEAMASTADLIIASAGVLPGALALLKDGALAVDVAAEQPGSLSTAALRAMRERAALLICSSPGDAESWRRWTIAAGAQGRRPIIVVQPAAEGAGANRIDAALLHFCRYPVSEPAPA